MFESASQLLWKNTCVWEISIGKHAKCMYESVKCDFGAHRCFMEGHQRKLAINFQRTKWLENQRQSSGTGKLNKIWDQKSANKEITTLNIFSNYYCVAL